MTGEWFISTGHHIANTQLQNESTDNAIRCLTTVGVPTNKIVIGSAFYARTWEELRTAMVCTSREV
jgi:chitinase